MSNNEKRLNFFTSNMAETARETSQFNLKLKLPQLPMRQSWIVVYPLLAYKNFTPDNREICIVHLA